MMVDDENSIFVGGLPYECTKAQLRRAFELYGSIVSVKVYVSVLTSINVFGEFAFLAFLDLSCLFWFNFQLICY
ncbi:unnamed protein product [Amaranthus hypochondriacus]